MYHVAQNFDEEKHWWMDQTQNFDKQNFDELVIGFIEETLREKC